MTTITDHSGSAVEPWHGTPGGYSNRKCRCNDCRMAWNKYCADRKRNKRANYTPKPEDEHGTEKNYQNGCSCAECKAAHSRYTLDSLKREPTREGDCEICGLVTQVIWDHSHKTGSHRGWLCINCNQGLGLLGDDIKLIQEAIAYLNRNQT